jgi:membrane dipeptidase
MHLRAHTFAAALCLASLAGCGGERPSPSVAVVAPSEAEPPASNDGPPAVPEPAPPPARPLLAIDTHVDTPQRMLDAGDDIGQRLPDGHLDLPRMREGELTGAFFSVWVDPRRFPGEAAWQRALALTRVIREVAERHPDQAVLATSAADVRRAHAEGKIALLVGVEGAHALGAPGDDEVLLARLRQLFELGARYLTVTWTNDNPLAHASTGRHPDRGLTELGRRAVREMNRMGMIVDVSHVSDRTFWDVLEVSERPVLASHSSCRALADHPRNMTDAMIRALGERGGAVCINYYTQFIDTAYADRRRRLERMHADRFDALREAHPRSWQRWAPHNALARELDATLEAPTIETLGAHFAHVVELAGPEAVCLGSDFDGVGELPVGLEDASRLGALRAELERRGLPLAPILGENVLRILEAQAGPSTGSTR